MSPSDYGSKEHGRYTQTAISTIASQVQFETGKLMSPYIIMAGSDYVYLAFLEYFDLPDGFKLHPGMEMGKPFNIHPLHLVGTEEGLPLTKIIDDFFPESKEISLIPDGKSRWEEAQRIGVRIDETQYSFKVQYHGRMFSVYKVRDALDVQMDDIPGGRIGIFPEAIKRPKNS